ncbi:hypothetical protein [Desulfosporosinus sp. BG]|uniref:hypothetical protein n=1 Tax=Desulfosporosinus sp. BG TaxID=1633135 RepID=UPI00083A8EAB|nr:hypothetical protein [Desulfosporosinus sp. BG]
MDENKPKKLIRRLSLIFFLLLNALVLTACSQATSKPEITIKTQEAGLAAGDVTISADVANFELVDQEGEQNNPGKGHIIYYMDVPVPKYYEHTAISKPGTYGIASNTSYTWKGVTPGEHTFSVQLVNNNDSPLPAPAINSKTVNVGPPAGKPDILIVTPAEGAQLGPGTIALSVKINNFVISKDDMGVVNRKGEGHLIYYLDENPPVDPGVPALTDRSFVSTDLNRLWKDVSEGKHTFSVQLVNNDDTPLDVPVVVTMPIDLQAQ